MGAHCRGGEDEGDATPGPSGEEPCLPPQSGAPACRSAESSAPWKTAAFPSHPKATSRKECNVSSVTRLSEISTHNLDESSKTSSTNRPLAATADQSGLSRAGRTAGHWPWVPGEEGDRKLSVIRPPEQTQLPESAKS